MSETLRKLLKDKDEKNINKIADKFVIEKFTNKRANASQRMEEFEKDVIECNRFDIIQSIKKLKFLNCFWKNPLLIGIEVC